MNIEIYTDGCCLGNPGRGGYGIVIRQNDRDIEISDGYKLTTNNRMELLAIIIALEYFKTEKENLTIYTDSNYVVSSINNKWIENWKRNKWRTKTNKNVKNKDLWERLLVNLEKHNVKFIWVKGHAQNKYNNKCDEIANIAARQSVLKVDENYESDN